MKSEALDAEIHLRRELVARIVESRHFNRSPRQSGFLRYLCNSVFEHPGRELHEQHIGVELFRRDAGYDTSLDNIVRVNASELRKRLALYFENEGASEPVILEIPRGGYTPSFVPRLAPDPVPVSAPPPPDPAPPRNPRTAFWIGLLSLTCLLLLASTVWLALRNRDLRRNRPFDTPALGLLWSRILPENGSADLVVADSSLSLLQDILHRSVSLQHYLSHDYISQMQEIARPLDREAEVNWLTSRRYTSLADIDLVATILRASRGGGFSVQFARDYSADRFRSANAVFIGSKRSNPWVEVFEDQMNFRIDYDEASAEPLIRNRRPVPGEPLTYRLADHTIDTPDAFSVVAFLPNQNRTGNVLIIAGSGMQGTRAAGDLVTSEVEFAHLLDRFGHPWPAKLRHFELLLKTRIMGGSVRGLEIVSQRLYD
jgi:hypothetical protein